MIICFAMSSSFQKDVKNSLTCTMLYCNVYVCTFFVIICWQFNRSNTQFLSQCSDRRFNVCGILGWMKQDSFPWQSLACVLAHPLLSLRSQLQPQPTPLSPPVDCTAPFRHLLTCWVARPIDLRAHTASCALCLWVWASEVMFFHLFLILVNCLSSFLFFIFWGISLVSFQRIKL